MDIQTLLLIGVAIITIAIALLFGLVLLRSPTDHSQDNVDVDSGLTRIIVSTEMKPMEAYRQANITLQDEGFRISNSDSDLLTLSTHAQESYAGTWGMGIADVAVNINVREVDGESEIHITGTTPFNGTIESGGMRGSAIDATFQSLVHIALQLGDDLRFE